MGTRVKGKRLHSQPQGILRIFLHSVYFFSTPKCPHMFNKH